MRFLWKFGFGLMILFLNNQLFSTAQYVDDERTTETPTDRTDDPRPRPKPEPRPTKDPRPGPQPGPQPGPLPLPDPGPRESRRIDEDYRSPYYWVTATNGKIPPDAVVAGVDADGGLLYAGRTLHKGNILPCKIAPSRYEASFSYNREELPTFVYEVLCGSKIAWQSASNGKVPKNAIIGGLTSGGEKLYIGRAFYACSLTPGKIHPSHNRLYIPFDREEVAQKVYEVAVHL
ncbi:uncharacterized protein LOC135839196 [Planococcus citri]|uniref:uncharacterized protein LOC135839196 n=1 Tax=Planococcus citri TaxID=170843 RepID=UPI0031F75762